MANEPDTDSPAFPVRAVAYVRVSQARDGMISPELQVTAIRDYCERRGYSVRETLQDLDLSGRFWKLRQVERAIAMIEADEADVIVVWRWSRVSRNRLDWAMAVDRVEAAGGRLESSTEGFDTTTSSGRLARGMLAELAAFESDRTGDIWREVRDRRLRQGLPPNGAVQFGYRKGADGTYTPDRRTGPLLAQIFRRYVDGEGHKPLAQWLNDAKVRTPRTKHIWSAQTLAQVMDNGFAAGLVKWGGAKLPGAHKPLIDMDLWTAYVAARDSRRQVHAPRDGSHLLTGIVWCGCGSPMRNGRKTAPTTRAQYICNAHPTNRHGSAISRQRCDAIVRHWLSQMVIDPAAAAATTAAVQRWVANKATRAAELRDAICTAPLGDRVELLAELEAVRSAAAVPSAIDAARSVLEDWDVIEPADMHRRLRTIMTRVDVFNDRAEPLLHLHTTWGTVEPFVGWHPQARPVPPQLLPPAAAVSEAAALDPLQLLRPSEAARIAQVTPHTVWSWYAAGRLPNTVQSLAGHRLYSVQDIRAVRPSARHTGGWDTRRARAAEITDLSAEL